MREWHLVSNRVICLDYCNIPIISHDSRTWSEKALDAHRNPKFLLGLANRGNLASWESR